MSLRNEDIDARIADLGVQLTTLQPGAVRKLLEERRAELVELKAARAALAELRTVYCGCDVILVNHGRRVLADDEFVRVCHKHGIDPDALKGGE